MACTSITVQAAPIATLTNVGFGDASGAYLDTDCTLGPSYIGTQFSIVTSLTINGSKATIVYNVAWNKDSVPDGLTGISVTRDPGTYIIYTLSSKTFSVGNYTNLTATITSVTPV